MPRVNNYNIKKMSSCTVKEIIVTKPCKVPPKRIPLPSKVTRSKYNT